ncbi:hypothetical protein NQ176_g2723 [Zarea fungicola]|uniref:Uncharacterized protein n=1 Tax=Zarea fungicola TaxID=93591 RepID=A0ACC1NPM0_9HYPO|nr:hypothetical protein NQ176_g2723 [Lecanicillium fungicola]
MASATPHGTPVGLEIPVKDTSRAAAFYAAVFGWQSAPSQLGIPVENILTFSVSGGVLPIGGAFRRVEETELATVKGTSKLYFYVDDIAAAIEARWKPKQHASWRVFSDVTSDEYSCADTSQQFVVENPATGKPITIVQAGSTETTASAVEASQAAFQLWQLKSRQERCTYLLRAADELQKHTEELTLSLCLENGKPYKDASFDIMVLLGVFRYFASIADKLPSEFFDQGSIYSAVIYEPYGAKLRRVWPQEIPWSSSLGSNRL